MSASPSWATWSTGEPYTLGIEEEAMLLDRRDGSLAQRSEELLPTLPSALVAHLTPETHLSALELSAGPAATVGEVVSDLHGVRSSLQTELGPHGLVAASAGTHPCTMWHETVVSSSARYRLVYDSMRELARREPTYALHVHVGVNGPERAIRLMNRMRAHLPVLLALSANSPFWQGRDTGLASARTPLFQAFPRVGIPRAFEDYGDWVEAVDVLIRSEAFPEPTFLWWDVRPQPRFGTVEVRILDAQTTVRETGALAALVQCVAHLELEEGYVSDELVRHHELLSENRFIAARDGMGARLLDPVRGGRVPVRQQVRDLIDACLPHARSLGCEDELASIRRLAERPGADRQLGLARRTGGPAGVASALAALFPSRTASSVEPRVGALAGEPAQAPPAG